MISYRVEDVKQFMNLLLISSAFDEWEMREVKLNTLVRYTVSGTVNPQYLTEEEAKERTGSYVSWSEIRPVIKEMIKGKHSPSLFHVVLAYPVSRITEVDMSQVESLLVNIHFENGKLQLITAVATKTFVLDRSPEHFWDEWIVPFMSDKKIPLMREKDSVS